MNLYLLRKYVCLILLSFILVLISQQGSAAENLSAQAAVEKTEVYVGEPFIFQLQIEGHDNPDKPDVSDIKDFTLESLGGEQNSSSSVTIINGKMTQVLRRGYIFSYRLTAVKAGLLTIPAITVSAEGQTTSTQSIQIRAIMPTQTEDFKLRTELSTTECYVGQPVTMTVTWYVGKDVEGFQFNLPVLTDERFDVADVDTPIDPGQKNLYLPISLGDGEVIGKKGRHTLDGKEYMTVRFQKVLIPRERGNLMIPQGTVTCNVVVGYQKRKRLRDPFESFFEHEFFFERRGRAVVKKFVVPSNKLTLTVLALPEDGRPANFTGLVGNYSIVASAAPTQVSVGEPITLTIQVAGPDYLEQVELPPLHQQPALARDFKIPAEMAPGKVEGRVKTFTQTIRAKNADVKAIPSIDLPFFNAKSGKFDVARTKPIPLSVSATRIVTAQDAEGRVVPGETRSELESWMAGIAYNYEDLSVVKNQAHGPAIWVRSPVWMTFIALPPAVYFILLASIIFIRRRNADPAAQKARRAYGVLIKKLANIRKGASMDPVKAYGSVLEAFQHYLGSKLRLPPGAITFNDVKEVLREQRANEGILDRLKVLFAECEASRYAGTAVDNNASITIIDYAMSLAKDLEKSLP